MDDPKTATHSGEGDQEPTVEELREQLEKKEQDIQFLKGKWGEEKSQLTQEQQALRDKVAQFEGRLEEQSNLFNKPQETETKDPFALTEDQMDEIRDDPTKVIDLLRETQTSTIGSILAALDERDKAFLGKVDELNGSVQSRFKELDPELQQWKPAIEELRQDESLKDLDEKALIAVAKRMDMKPAMEYRGAAGGQRQHSESQQKPRAFDPNADDTATRIAMRLANDNTEHAKKLWEAAEARRLG